MIVEYHRPTEIKDALDLLGRGMPITVPLGGGSKLSKQAGEEIAVVDLQSLGMNWIERDGLHLEIGAAATLQSLFVYPDTPGALQEAIGRTATLNTRNSATVGGAIAVGTGESPLLTSLLALDTQLIWLPDDVQVSLGDFLALRHVTRPGLLIHRVRIPLTPLCAFAGVGRTPQDAPQACVAVAKWPGGRVRIALGGAGATPVLAVDGINGNGIGGAVKNACSHITNPDISNTYAQIIYIRLSERLLQKMGD